MPNHVSKVCLSLSCITLNCLMRSFKSYKLFLKLDLLYVHLRAAKSAANCPDFGWILSFFYWEEGFWSTTNIFPIKQNIMLQSCWFFLASFVSMSMKITAVLFAVHVPSQKIIKVAPCTHYVHSYLAKHLLWTRFKPWMPDVLLSLVWFKLKHSHYLKAALCLNLFGTNYSFHFLDTPVILPFLSSLNELTLIHTGHFHQ